MANINSIGLKAGDVIVSRDGSKVKLSEDASADSILIEGDIVCHKKDGAITQYKGNNKDEVLLDIDGTLTKDTSDDVKTAVQTDAGYDGFWSRIFRAGTGKQDTALMKDRNAEYQTKGLTIKLDPSKADKETPKPPSVVFTNGKDAAKVLLDGLPWDGKKAFSLQELGNLNKSENGVDDKTRAAIKYFIDHSKEFEKLAVYGQDAGPGDGRISMENCRRYIKGAAVPAVETTTADEPTTQPVVIKPPTTSITNGNDAAKGLLEGLPWDGNKTFSLLELTRLYKNNKVDDNTRAAINYFSHHPEEFDKLDAHGNGAGPGDGRVSKQDCRDFMAGAATDSSPSTEAGESTPTDESTPADESTPTGEPDPSAILQLKGEYNESDTDAQKNVTVLTTYYEDQNESNFTMEQLTEVFNNQDTPDDLKKALVWLNQNLKDNTSPVSLDQLKNFTTNSAAAYGSDEVESTESTTPNFADLTKGITSGREAAEVLKAKLLVDGKDSSDIVELRKIAGDENADPDLRTAAQFFINHPNEFEQMQNHRTRGRRDNGENFNSGNVSDYIAKQPKEVSLGTDDAPVSIKGVQDAGNILLSGLDWEKTNEYDDASFRKLASDEDGDPTVRAAAQWFVDNPEQLRALQEFEDKGQSSKFNKSNLENFVNH